MVSNKIESYFLVFFEDSAYYSILAYFINEESSVFLQMTFLWRLKKFLYFLGNSFLHISFQFVEVLMPNPHQISVRTFQLFHVL